MSDRDGWYLAWATVRKYKRDGFVSATPWEPHTLERSWRRQSCTMVQFRYFVAAALRCYEARENNGAGPAYAMLDQVAPFDEDVVRALVHKYKTDGGLWRRIGCPASRFCYLPKLPNREE